ncbi:pilin [Luteimonas aquatica]|uniref:pilin n=1 Tax=Luteimonas aquatica TaxID=450364 RepID=UPI001F55E513|nr:pilin [Luteimonas aquatica]
MDQTVGVAAGDFEPQEAAETVSAPTPPHPARRRSSLIAVAVFAVAELLVVAVVALLGYHTYRDYRLRADVQDLLARVAPLRPAVDAAYARNGGRCLRDAALARQLRSARPEAAAASLAAGEFDNGRCGILLVLHGGDALEGRQILWERRPADAAWRCTSDLPGRYLPPACRPR